MAIRSKVHQRLEERVHAGVRRLSRKGKLRRVLCVRKNSLQRPYTGLFLVVKTGHLPISPSKTLLRFADQVESFGRGTVLDAPCGYGRNAVALAARGCTVVAVDNDQGRLAALEQVKSAYIAERASPGLRIGKITFGGQGENFRVLPKAGQLRDLFSRHVEFKYYKERKVDPTEFNSVSVTLFAQKTV
jgi:SAM-dependent methyltransferase